MGIGDKEMTIKQFMRRARGYARLAATRKDNVLERVVVWAGSHGDDETMGARWGRPAETQLETAF
jgi:hypothetical protein